jgi:hypothetical protein
MSGWAAESAIKVRTRAAFFLSQEGTLGSCPDIWFQLGHRKYQAGFITINNNWHMTECRTETQMTKEPRVYLKKKE